MAKYEYRETPTRRTFSGKGAPRGRRPGPLNRSYNTAKVVDPCNPPSWVPHPRYASLHEAPPELRARATYKANLVRGYVAATIEHAQTGEPLNGSIVEYARRAAAALGLPDPGRSAPTLYRWATIYRYFGELGLIDAPAASADKPKVAGDVPSISEAQVQRLRMALRAGDQGYARLRNMLIATRKDGEEIPSYDVARRAAMRIERDEAHLISMARYGRIMHRSRIQTSLAHGVFPAGMRFAVDSTVCDVWVRVRDLSREGSWRVLRPVLSTVQDVGSRYVTAFNLSLYAIDSGTISATFARAVYQDLQHHEGLISLGLPEEVKLDRGAEHQGEFRKNLKEHGVAVIGSRDENPRGNARLERFTKTITEGLFRDLPGYSAKERAFNPYLPKETDSKRNLRQLRYEPYRRELGIDHLLTLEAFEARVLGWICAFNAQPHAGLNTDDDHIIRVVELYDRSDANNLWRAA